MQMWTPCPKEMCCRDGRKMSKRSGEFVTLRDYELGDDLRRVHWRSTARTGELMIRQDEARWRSRAAIVLDVHPDGHDTESFELAVEAVASVVSRLAREGTGPSRVQFATSRARFAPASRPRREWLRAPRRMRR